MSDHKEPQPGDVIWADRISKGLPYNHCGIYESGGYVIHFAAPEGSETSQENAVIHRAAIADFKNGCELKIVDFPQGFSAEETLRRARSRVGEKGYNFATNNCDHFATWCKTGEHRSLQVDDAKRIVVEMGGAIGEMACAVHDIAQDFKSPALGSIDMIQKPKEILDKLDLNTDITSALPPVQAEPDAQPGEKKTTCWECGAELLSTSDKFCNSCGGPVRADPDITDKLFESEPVEYKVVESAPVESHADVSTPTPMASPKGETGGENLPPPKKAWYERVGDAIKDLTYPVAGAFEVLKRTALPKLRPVPFTLIGAKVRNVIDKIVTKIKVFTGRITPQQAQAEIRNNEAALLGQVVIAKQPSPIREVVKQTFGRIGSAIKHKVQQVVTRIVPQPVREAIKTGFQKVGQFVAKGVKAVVGAVAKVGGFFKRLLFG